MRRFETKEEEILISSFETSKDDLVRIACCAVSAYCAMHSVTAQPKIICCDYDDDFGNSVLVRGKFIREIKE